MLFKGQVRRALRDVLLLTCFHVSLSAAQVAGQCGWSCFLPNANWDGAHFVRKGSNVDRRLPTRCGWLRDRPVKVCVSASSVGGERERWEKFVRWAQRCDISWQNWDVTELGSGLRGARATANVAEGDVLIQVPANIALIVREGQQCPLPTGIVSTQLWEEAADLWELRMALLLLYHKSLGAASTFKPYLDVLPKFLDLPLSYSRRAVAALGHPRFEREVLADQRFWAAQFEKLRSGMADPPDMDAFVWAVSCAMTRTFKCSFHGRHAPAHVMCPMLDMVNHHPRSSPAFSWTAQNPTGAGEGTTSSDTLPRGADAAGGEEQRLPGAATAGGEAGGWFQLIASQHTARGEEVCISYGPFANQHLLERYGFVLADNVHDFVCVSEAELWSAAWQCAGATQPLPGGGEPCRRVLEETITVLQRLMAPGSSLPAPLQPLATCSLLLLRGAPDNPRQVLHRLGAATSPQGACPEDGVAETGWEGAALRLKHDADLTPLRVYARTLAAAAQALRADPEEGGGGWDGVVAEGVRAGAAVSADNSAMARQILQTALQRQLTQAQAAAGDLDGEGDGGGGSDGVQVAGARSYRLVRARLLEDAIRSVAMRLVL